MINTKLVSLKNFFTILVVIVVFVLGIVELNGELLQLTQPLIAPSATASTVQQIAGNALTPLNENVTAEWLWDASGLFLLTSGSNIAKEMLSETAESIANLQGVVYSKHYIVSKYEFDYFVWFWTPVAIYNYHARDEQLLLVRDRGGQDISGIENIKTFPGLDAQNDEVWLWTDTNFYRMSLSIDGNAVFIPNSQPVAHIQDITPTPDPRYVFLWTLTSLYLYDMVSTTMSPVLNSDGVPIAGVNGIWIEPVVTIELSVSFFTIFIWNDIDLYRIHFPPGPRLEVVKILNSAGGAMNQVRGMAKTLTSTNDSVFWVWTSRNLYLLDRVLGNSQLISLQSGDNVLESITWATACPYQESPLFLWNDAYLAQVNSQNDSIQFIARPDGAVRHNHIRQVVPCSQLQLAGDFSSDVVWWWDNDGVYRREVLGADPLSYPIFTPEQTYLPQLRGLIIGFTPYGQEVWLWNDRHVYQYQLDVGQIKEVLGPEGQSLTNVWMVMTRVNLRNETEAGTVLIRNSQSVYQYSTGNERAIAVLVGNGMRRAITSPPYIWLDGNIWVGRSTPRNISIEADVVSQPNTILQSFGGIDATITSISGYCDWTNQGIIQC